ncbi:MAG TPA: hypothetical protein VJJ83_01535, partial [Candidatus Babeliales bacterium]|nr:hypothetical protein [Candidatus Babeliales bacterium]
MKLVKRLVISGFSLSLTGLIWAAAEPAAGPGQTIDFTLANATRAHWSQELLTAVQRETLDLAAIRTALRNHADVEVQDTDGRTPLMILAQRCDDPAALAAMQLLLTEAGADV